MECGDGDVITLAVVEIYSLEKLVFMQGIPWATLKANLVLKYL